jgi:hypothetical protein
MNTETKSGKHPHASGWNKQARRARQSVPARRLSQGTRLRRPSVWFYPISLRCNETEDTFGLDELKLVIGATAFDLGSIEVGRTRDLQHLNGVPFRSSIQVELWDLDTGIFDSDDILGRHTINFADEPKNEERTRTFKQDGANYELTFVLETDD